MTNNNEVNSESQADNNLTQEQGIPNLRTMKYDAAKYLKDKEMTFIDMVAKEKEKDRSEEFLVQESGSEKIITRALMSLVVLVVLAVGGYAAYVFLAERNTLPGGEAPVARSFFPTDEREIIDVRAGDRAGFLSKLESTRRDRLPSGSIKHVIVRIEQFDSTSHLATPDELFSLLDYKPPSDLARNLNDTFNLLIYYRPSNSSFGLILEPKNYEEAVGHMRDWEENLALNFKTLYFDHQIAPTSQPFVDAIVRNIDVRKLGLSDNQSLSYAFYTRRYMLISTADDLMDIMIERFLISPPR